MNSMEYHHKTTSGSKSEGAKEPENDKKYPLSFKFKRIFLAATVGFTALLSGCGAVESRAMDNIQAANVPAEVANDPDLIWFAMNGATTEEIQDYAHSLMMQTNPMSDPNFNPARETQMSIDATKQAEATDVPTTEPTVAETSINFESVSPGVYSFVVAGITEVANRDFAQSVKDALKQTTGVDSAEVVFGVPDDAYGVTRIFLGSNVEAYYNTYGGFYAYQGDTIYTATDTQTLIDFLKSTGISYETFSSLP